MNRKQLFTTVLAAGVAVSLTAVATIKGGRPVPPPARPAAAVAAAKAKARQEQIKRGEYMVTIGGCNDCHTPWIMGPNGPEPDMTRTLSGHPKDFPIVKQAKLDSAWGYAGAATNTAFSGPWGVSFAANLTPDKNFGTGIWTPEIFRNTIRNGRHWGVARPLLPPMPWFNYRKMTDEDLNAVFAYLQSLPPIPNEVPTPLPPQQAPKKIASK